MSGVLRTQRERASREPACRLRRATAGVASTVPGFLRRLAQAAFAGSAPLPGGPVRSPGCSGLAGPDGVVASGRDARAGGGCDGRRSRAPSSRSGLLRLLPARAASLLAPLALLLAALVFAQPASAQTIVDLIANDGQTSADADAGAYGTIYATSFTTGSHSTGYKLTRVGVWLKTDGMESDPGSNADVNILTDAAGTPGVLFGVASITDQPTTSWAEYGADIRPGRLLTTPVGIDLAADTTYWVVVSGGTSHGGSDDGHYFVGGTASDNEDSGGLSGWSLGNNRLLAASDGSWDATNTNANALRLELRGSTRATANLPSAPTGLTVSAGTGSGELDVSWTKPSGTILDHDLRYYEGAADPTDAADWIEEGEQGGPPDPGAAPLATITGLKAGTAYRVQVRAASVDGEGAWSASVAGTTADPGPPSAPTGLTVSAGTNSGELDASWTAPSGTITDYDLRYYEGSADPTDAADWVEEHETDGLGTADSTATSATIKGLKSSTAYRVQVRAGNAGGESAWSASVAATTGSAPASNRAPKVMTLGGDGTCKLWTDTSQPSDTFSAGAGTWTPLTLKTRGTETADWPITCSRVGNKDAPVFDDQDAGDLYYTMSYTLPDNVRGVGGNAVLSVGNDQLSVLAVAIGTAASFRVDLTARDEHGASASTWVRVTVGVMTPAVGAPSFSATMTDQNAGTGTAFSLVLPAATGGDVSTLLGAINSPYTYAVSGLPAGLSFDAATRTVSGTPTAAGSFTVTYTVDDADALYSLKVSPEAADTADAASQTFTIKVTGGDLAPTTPPTGLTVSAGTNSGELDASWTAPSGTITDYDLRYYEGSADPTDAADWVEEHETDGLGTADSTATSATIKGLKSSTAYRVQVRAGNAGGESAWSASVAATTGSAPASNRAPKVMTLGGDGTCKLWTDTSQPSDTFSAGAGTWTPLTLKTRGTETADWPITCSRVGNKDAPVFDDQDAGDLYYTMSYTLPDNARGVGGNAALSVGNDQLRVLAVAIGTAASFRVDLTARDEHGASASTWVRVTVGVMTPAVGAPSFSATVPDQNAGTGTAFSLVLPAATGGDVSTLLGAINSPYTYAVSGLPAGLSFDAATRTVSGTPRASGTFTVTYTADDADAAYSLKASPDADDTADAASQTFTIKVGGSDLAPTAAPTGLTVSAVTGLGGALMASWTAPSGTVTGYDYDLRYYAGSTDPTDDALWIETGGAANPGASTSATITGLQPNTAYRVQVRAGNAGGKGPWSASAGGTTSGSLTLLSARVGSDGTKVTLYYDQKLDGASIPNPASFAVKVRNADRTPTAVRVAGSTVTLTVAAVGAGQPVAVSYDATSATSPIRSQENGVKAGSIVGLAAINDRGVKVPTVSSLAFTSTPTHDTNSSGTPDTYGLGAQIKVEVTFSEAVSVDMSRGAPGLWLHLHESSSPKWTGYVSGSGTTALTFAYTVVSGNSSNNGLSDAGSRVKANRIDLTGGMIASVATGLPADLTHGEHGPGIRQKVDSTLDGQGPRFESATVNGNALTITFDENLEPVSPGPTPDRFSVTATSPGGSSRQIPVSQVTFDAFIDTDFFLRLNGNVRPGEAVTVSYTKSTGGFLQGSIGNPVESFLDRPVTNTTLALKGFKTIGVSEGPQSGSLSVSWELHDTGSDPTGYDLRYYAGTEDPPPGREADWKEDVAGLPTDTAGTAKGATIEGLRANTAYRVQVRARTDIATGPWTSSTSGTTGTPPAGNNAPRVLGKMNPVPASGNVCEVVNISGPIKRAIVVNAQGGTLTRLANLVGHGGRTAVGNWPSVCVDGHPTLGRINPLFDDVDGDKLTLTAGPYTLPANVRVDPNNLFVTQNSETNNNSNGILWFTGQAAFRETAQLAVRTKVTATDPHGESVSVRVNFVVTAVVNVNGAPTLPEVGALDASPGRAVSHVLPAATGGDNFFIGPSQYYYALSGLPDGLTFDPETRRIFGTPSETGAFTVTYTADDPDTVGSAYLNPEETDQAKNLADIATRTFTLNVRPFIDRVRIVSAPTHDANGDGRNDTYVQGDKIAFDVEFTEPVEVKGIEDGDTANHVRMRLQVGPDGVNKRKTTDLKLANVFHGGKTLRFEWEVAAGDNDPDGVFVETFAGDNAVLRLKGTASIKGRISDLDANVTKTAFITGNAVGEDGLPMSYVNGRVGASAGPTPVSAVVTGETLSVTFDEELQPLSAADVEALPLHFAVQGASDNLGNRNAFQHPTGYRFPTGDLSTVVMTLGVPARAGDKITLTYKRIDHKGPLKSRILGGSGGDLAPAFVEFVVKNDTTGGTVAGAEGTLVSNTGQTEATNFAQFNEDHVQEFTTGSNTKGYKLTRVSLQFASAGSNTVDYKVFLLHPSGSGIATVELDKPTSLTAESLNHFDAPGTGIDLQPNSNYRINIDVTGSFSLTHRVTTTEADAEDAGNLSGWSIANVYTSRAWNSGGLFSETDRALRIAIHGFAIGTDPGPRPQSASVAGTELKIVFDKALDDTSSESGQHFKVVVSDRDYSQRTIAGTAADVTISGATVTVTLDDADGGVKPGEIASVTYDPPTLSLKAGEDNGRVARFENFNIETVYDTAVPELKQAAVVQTSKNPDGFRVALYYDEALDPDSVPATTDFGVTLDWTKGTDSGSTEATPNAVAVEGNTVVLTVDLAKAPADEAVDRDYGMADVTYTKGTNPIRDPAGNEAADVDKDDVDVEEAGAPAVVDTGETVTVETTTGGGEVTLVGNTGQSEDGTQDFSLHVNQRFTTGNHAAGYKLTSVAVPYTGSAPAASSHDILIFSTTTAEGGGLGTSLGTLSYGSVSGTTVTYTASGEGIDLAAGTQYFVLFDPLATPTGSQLRSTNSDDEDAAAAGWSLHSSSATWAGPGNTWVARPGVIWQLAIHGSAIGGTTTTQNQKPVLDLKTDGSRLTMTFDKSLDPASVPGPERFRLLHDADLGEELEYGKVSSVAVQGKQVALQLGFPVFPCSGERPFTLSYASSETGKNLRTMTGELAGDLDAALVTNGQWDKCPAAEVEVENDGASGNSGGTPGKQGKSLTVKFDRSLDRGKALKASLFGLAGASETAAPAVEGAAYAADGAAVVLTLARGLGRGETVTLSYTRPRGEPGLWDAEGNQIADFSGVPVPVRTSGAPAATGVELVSDAGDDDTYALGETVRVRVTFDEAVEVDTAGGTPRLAIDMDPAHWGTKRAVYESGSGTARLTFAHEVVQPNVSTRGIAVLANTLEANGGAIRSASTGTDAELGHDGLDHDPAHKVDWRLTPAPAANVPATGAPAIAGTAQVGATLTASAADIADANGLTGATFAWQWVSSDGATYADIAGATGASYTLTEAEQGRTVKVRVSFTDDEGNAETLVSAATAAVARRPLTAAFNDVPAEHDGERAFSFGLTFSEEVKLSSRTLKEQALVVGNGRVTKAKRVVKGENRRWTITVKPASWEDVTVFLVPAANCRAAGAVCTHGGKPLSGGARARILGPAVLSVADARADEGADAAVEFAVTLSRAASGTVTVDYTTRDGTATAGEDYTRTRGTLSFAAGELEKTVSVPVLDDALDEGEETFTLKLTNAQGAVIGDGEATGTIANDDPLQKMWLSRFGRTVADHVTAAVSDRLANPLAGAQVTVGGQTVNLAEVGDEAWLGQTLTSIARAMGAPSGPASGGDPGSGSGAGGWPGSAGSGPGQAGTSGWPGTGLGIGQSPAANAAPARDITGRELLLGSAFHLVRNSENGGPGLAAWGRVTTGSFDGEETTDSGTMRIDGSVTTGILGADAEWNRLLGGVAISVSEGEGTFAQPGVDKGAIESTMTTVSPYARFMVNDRVSVWGLAGWGTGDMTIVQAANENQPERVTRTDLEMRLGAIGGRGALLTQDADGGMDLALKADAFFVETESEAVSNEGNTTANASRLRLVLEGGRAFAMGDGATLRPSLELGLRHDGGDAETGTGVELGGGVAYTDPVTGLSVEAKARMLVAHADSNYEEWGVSGAVRLAPGERQRGLSFSLAPTLGATSSAAERLWGARDAGGLAPGGEFAAARGLQGELGYGMSVFGDRFTGTPNVGFGLSDSARDYRIGWRLTSAIEGDPGFEVNLDATRKEAANGNEPPEHGLMLRGAIRW